MTVPPPSSDPPTPAAVTLPEPPARGAGGLVTTDVAIVGAGLAGLAAAHHLPPALDVVVIDKGAPGRSGSSPWAQGGLAAAIGHDDSPQLHARDTIRAGDGLCDATAVDVLCTEAPARVAELLTLGAELDGGGSHPARTLGELHLAREGGQAVARSVHRADATGAELVRTFRRAVRDRVSRLQAIAARLAVADGRVVGVWVRSDAGLELVRARAVLLATGGCGGLFAATTNQPRATGDGVALAWLAGAAVRDLEFVQFHPTGLAVGGTSRLLLTEALRGAGATLHTADGDRFLVERHPDAELAPRHVVAKAIIDLPNGVAWLDATGIGTQRLEQEFPTVLAGAREHGFDLAAERVPITPAAHYMVGGVRTDLAGRCSVPGLYAAGEVASTGVHGANRMAGNSLSEALVFGARAATTIAAELAPLHDADEGPPLTSTAHAPRDGLEELQQVLWQGAGPVRSAERLARAAAGLASLRERTPTHSTDPESIEMTLALTTAELVVAGALLRTETRGGHVREDHPDTTWPPTHLERIAPAG